MDIIHDLPSKIAFDTLERYSGSPICDFCDYVILTNFPRYVDYFASSRNIKICEGAMFKVAHDKRDNITMIDFKIGSPAAALVIDLISFLPIKASLLLGMCGGLRRRYVIGEYLVPVAAIRGEGTSDFYFPSEVPSLANFVVQRAVTRTLELDDIEYNVGITHTTNKRFWEFESEFKKRIKKSRAQCIEMECATLFTASYFYQLPLGALLLISDLPLEASGIKTKESSEKVYTNHTSEHVELGVKSLNRMEELLSMHAKGADRNEDTEWIEDEESEEPNV